MKRYFFNLVASLAVGGTILISVPLAQAGGKGGFSGGSKGGSMRSSMGSKSVASRSHGFNKVHAGHKIGNQSFNRHLGTTKTNLHKLGGQHVAKHNLGTRHVANHGKLNGLNGKLTGNGTLQRLPQHGKFNHGKLNGNLHGKLTGNGGLQRLPGGKFPGKFDHGKLNGHFGKLPHGKVPGKLDGNFGKFPKFPGKGPGGLVDTNFPKPGFPKPNFPKPNFPKPNFPKPFPKPHFPTPPFCPPGLPPFQPCPPVCQPGGGWGGWCDWIPGFGGGNCGTVACPPSGGVTVIETVAQQPVVQAVAVEPQAAALPANIDLELIDLQLMDAGDAARNLGPRYRVIYRNAGGLAAGNFQVLLMASRDGSIDAEYPIATAEVAGLNGGETSQVDVRLPAAAQAADMAALIVAVDRALQVDDVNRDNNAAVIDRAALQVAAN